jgi:hypothetical protein
LNLDNHGRIRKLIHSQYFKGLQDVLFVFRVVSHLLADLPQHLHDFVHILPVCHSHIEDIPGVTLGHVGDRLDGAVRDDVDISGQISQRDGSKAHRLHQSPFVPEYSDISNRDQIL